MWKVHARFAEFRWTNRVVWSSPAMILTSATCHLFEKRWCEFKMGMRICIMHFASSLLRNFLGKFFFIKFLYGILLVLSRCCFHHLVENSIFLYKKDIQHFYIEPILFSENKIIRSVVGGKVDGEIIFGTRSEKPKIIFGTRYEKRKIYLAPNDSCETFYLAVKGLSITWLCWLFSFQYLPLRYSIYFIVLVMVSVKSSFYSFYS